MEELAADSLQHGARSACKKVGELLEAQVQRRWACQRCETQANRMCARSFTCGGPAGARTGGGEDSRKELVTRRNDLSRKLACWSPSGFFTLSTCAGGSKVSTTLSDKDGRLRAREPRAAPHQVSAARCARFLLRMYL